MYFVVRLDPPLVKGPYSYIQIAKWSLRKIAKIPNYHRMMVEVINGVIQEDPHQINGIDQTPKNGFDKYWDDWLDINKMVKLVKNQIGR